MKEFKPSKQFTLESFLSKYIPFRYKEDRSFMRMDYYNKQDPRQQYYRILSKEEIVTFKGTIGYHLGKRSPDISPKGYPTGFHIFDKTPYDYYPTNKPAHRKSHQRKTR